MERRSSKLVALGAAVFIAGAGLVFVGLRVGSPDPDTSARPPVTVVESPSAGDPDVVSQGGPTAPVVVVPKNHDAVAVRLSMVPGLAGYATPGDHINIYAAVTGGEGVGGLAPPYAKLVLSKVEVLDVTGGDGVADPTFLLALRPADAEALIFYASFESLWATLTTEDAASVRTGGVDHSVRVGR